jgi:hypothetical protein
MGLMVIKVKKVTKDPLEFKDQLVLLEMLAK